jgi:hypothetical protein
MLENGHLYGTQGFPLEEGLWWIFNSCSCVVLYMTEGYLSLLHVFQIVEREVISYGSQDACRIEACISWALPYAQRYMLQHHNEHYNSLENLHFAEEVKKLQCVVVDQLYFRYTLQSGRHCSRCRLDCGALLQVFLFGFIHPIYSSML